MMHGDLMVMHPNRFARHALDFSDENEHKSRTNAMFTTFVRQFTFKMHLRHRSAYVTAQAIVCGDLFRRRVVGGTYF